jgi:hypothetical protein
MLAGLFALTPGTLVWLVVLGIYLMLRRLGPAGLSRRLRDQEAHS